MNEEQFYKLYEKYNFPGLNKLYQIARREGWNITYKDVENFLRKQITTQLYTKPVKPSGHILSYSPDSRVQMDIIWMKRFSNANNGNKYILLFADVFTRKITGYPMKSKDIESVEPRLKEYLENNPRPNVIISDNEKSFISPKVRKLMNGKDDDETDDIIHSTVDPGYHAALGIIDSAVKKLKIALYKYMTTNKTLKWVDKLDDIIKNINDTPNSGLLGLSPSDVKDKETIRYIQVFNHNKLRTMARTKPQFKVGDKVRIEILSKAIKQRAYDKLYENDIYTIVEIKLNGAVLDNGKTYPFTRLKQVDEPTEHKKERATTVKRVDVVDVAKEQQLREERRKREDRDIGNILEKRTRGKRVNVRF
jgi:hypothetical protein